MHEIKNKEYKKGIVTGAVIALVVTGGARGVLRYINGGVLSDESHVKKLEYLEKMIDQDYLGDKNEDQLAEGIYAGLIYGLGDVYSRYYTADEYEQETSSTDGSYVGIGISMEANKEGGVRIAECYEGGPGEAAGLETGDVISAVDGEDITEMSTSEVSGLIRDSGKDKVTLTIHREGEEKPLDIIVEIRDVVLHSVSGEMLDDENGYIRISEFTGVTPDQYQEMFKQLESQGMKRLVIDLRDNPGGLLDSVCSILNHVLPEGMIVYTEDKHGNREEEKSDGKDPLEIPFAVLVNENSASASEIFAGAVQDYGIGTIVGTTTYGKGVVQSVRKLQDGSAVKLTVSNYFTPKGNSINKVGIKPDVEVKLDTELLNQKDITHEEDNQLQKALEVIAKK